MARISKNSVFNALDRAARNIIDAGGDDKRISRKDVEQKLETLKGTEKSLTDMFFRFADHRDAAPGAVLTEGDVYKTLEYAKEKLIKAYDVNRNGLSKDEIALMSTTGKLAVELARELKAVDAPEPEGQDLQGQLDGLAGALKRGDMDAALQFFPEDIVQTQLGFGMSKEQFVAEALGLGHEHMGSLGQISKIEWTPAVDPNWYTDAVLVHLESGQSVPGGVIVENGQLSSAVG